MAIALLSISHPLSFIAICRHLRQAVDGWIVDSRLPLGAYIKHARLKMATTLLAKHGGHNSLAHYLPHLRLYHVAFFVDSQSKNK